MLMNDIVRVLQVRKSGHLVEWVEKSLRACLNRLFVINVVKWRYTNFLIEKNLKGVLSSPTHFAS